MGVEEILISMVIRSLNSSSIYRLNSWATFPYPKLITMMQIYQALVMTRENLYKEELEWADENKSMIKGAEIGWNREGTEGKGPQRPTENAPGGVQVSCLKLQNSCSHHVDKINAPASYETPVALCSCCLWSMVHRQQRGPETQGAPQNYISRPFSHLQTSQFLPFG